MQFTLVTSTTLALASLVAASPTPQNQCNTGDIQCCNSVQAANSVLAAGLLGVVGAVVADVTAMVGITCSPISELAIGGNSCSAQPVCCTDNSFNGVVAIGCTPININL